MLRIWVFFGSWLKTVCGMREKMHETSKPTKIRMENEPWDSALFDWKPAKFYLCPP